MLRGETDNVPEDFVDWQERSAESASPLPMMAVYRAAAAMFNSSLAAAQERGKCLN